MLRIRKLTYLEKIRFCFINCHDSIDYEIDIDDKLIECGLIFRSERKSEFREGSQDRVKICKNSCGQNFYNLFLNEEIEIS